MGPGLETRENDMSKRELITYFGVWLGPWIVTLRVFGWLFQVKLVKNELISQRQDRWRMRMFGVSVKLFGHERKEQ